MTKTVYSAFSADVLHDGHINILNTAAQYGDVVVGLLSDEVISEYKRPPLLDYSSRVKLFESFRAVSKVVKQDSLSFKTILEELRPDYVIHGDDWRTGFQSSIRQEVIELLSKWGGELIEVPYTKDVSSTKLEEGLRSYYRDPDARRGMLRKLLKIKPCLRIMESSNGLSGLIVEETKIIDSSTGKASSFDGMWVSSLCDSTFKGKPDIELVDFTSRLNTISEIMEVTTKPIILDGDTGGRIEHFAHNIKTLERIGVSMVIIEDKTGLKQNSLFGTEVAQVQEDPKIFAAKIKAGKQAQSTRDLMICSRIESLIAGQDVPDAINRAKHYIEDGGADAVMIHSKEKDGSDVFEFLEDFRDIYPHVPVVLVPTSYNQFTEDELSARGANIVIYANHLLRAAYPAMLSAATTILETGRSKEVDDLCLPIKEIISLIKD